MTQDGYSKFETDFLGNERLVHYDSSGAMIGASAVTRAADGSVHITSDVPAVPIVTGTQSAGTQNDDILSGMSLQDKPPGPPGNPDFPDVSNSAWVAAGKTPSAAGVDPLPNRVHQATSTYDIRDDASRQSTIRAVSLAVGAFAFAVIVATLFLRSNGTQSRSGLTDRGTYSGAQRVPESGRTQDSMPDEFGGGRNRRDESPADEFPSPRTSEGDSSRPGQVPPDSVPRETVPQETVPLQSDPDPGVTEPNLRETPASDVPPVRETPKSTSKERVPPVVEDPIDLRGGGE